MFGQNGFSLSIRKKVIIGLTVSLLAVVFIGGLSYRYLTAIETKQHVVAIADDLSNLILEIRRYEKNYLLYASQEDLRENRGYIQQATETLADILPEINTLSIAPELNRLGQQLREYSEFMDRRAGCVGQPSTDCTDLEEHVRESGKKLVELSQLLVRIERERILQILRSLENNLIVSLAILLGMGPIFIFFVGAKIVRPLRTIERTTLRIAQGDFTPLSVGKPRDETQRVMEAFNSMIAELEKRQEQLVQAQKLSSIGILASGIAHQLNNPLNNISTSLQILSEEFGHGNPDLTKRFLANCLQEILRAQEIVKGLLEFSRQREFALRATLLRDVVERAVRRVSSQVPSGIEIKTDIPPNIQLDMDGQRMQEVLLNLLLNATQSIKELPGQIRISARSATATDQKPVIEIVVEDTGKGIDPKDIGRIFDPFFTTKEVGAGTGLGLSIVYGIVEKHRGTIRVESRPGAGTRFVIRLPMTHGSESM
jgi:two-component system, NtrC family, sensor kinase